MIIIRLLRQKAAQHKKDSAVKQQKTRMSVSVCRTDLMALDLITRFLAHRFYVLVLLLSHFSYSSHAAD